MEFIKDEFYIEYTAKEKIDGQTIKVEFQGYLNNTQESYYWGIALVIYNKRKHESRNYAEKLITGKSLKGLMFAREAIIEFEKFIVKQIPEGKHMIYTGWADNRRRDLYARSLLRLGYKYGMLTFDGETNKYLFKKL
jgi:hypothetical protein